MLTFKEFLTERTIGGHIIHALRNMSLNSHYSRRPIQNKHLGTGLSMRLAGGDEPFNEPKQPKATKTRPAKDPNTIHLGDERPDKPMGKKHQFRNTSRKRTV